MIQIQATKATPTSRDPAERYRTDGGLKRTHTPILFGIVITTIVLYIKSIFSGDARPEQPEPASPDESPELVKLSEPKAARQGENDDTEYTGEVAEAAEGPAARPRFLELTASGPLDAIDSRTFDFWNPNARDKWNAFKVSPVMPTPDNDNGTTGKGPGQATSLSGASGGGGGSGPSAGSGGRGPSGSGGEPGGSPGVTKPTEPSRSDPLPHQDDDGDVGGDDDDDDTATPNRAPRVSGAVYLMDVVGCATMLIGMSDLLRFASDPDGDTLTITGLKASSGALTATAGGWTFQGGGIGPVTLTYRITDGQYSVVQTATFSVVPQPPIVGTEGDDNLLGSMCADQISGLGGDDNIDARAGHDVVAGGGGDDHIVGGDGNDRLFGEAGNDVVHGGGGADHIFGGAGNDRLFGEEGNDIVFGDAGDDLISGGHGRDLLVGGTGDDTVQGDAGNDTVEGGEGNDDLAGGDGDDVLSGDAGDDTIAGGAGDDVLIDGIGADTVAGGDGDDLAVAAADGAADRYSGGSGSDTMQYSAMQKNVTVDLGAQFAHGAEIGHDHVEGFEGVHTGSGCDDIKGTDASEVLKGNDGDDVIKAGGGNDVVEGGAGKDELHDGAGADVVDAGGDDDMVMAAADGANDTLDGGAGHDTLDYSCATGDLDVDLVQGIVSGAGTGTDVVAEFEAVIGGEGDDRMQGASGPEVLNGNGGDDVIDAGGGDDVVEGGAGDDDVEGGAGDDVLNDGAGADVVEGGSGDDTVVAAADDADDAFDGGAGHDTLDYSSATEDLDIDLVEGAVSGTGDWADEVSDFESVVGGQGDDHFHVGSSPTVLKGNGGENVFEFETDVPQDQVLLHEIVDFKMGDRIKMSKYDIFEKVIGKIDEEFDRIYGDDPDTDDAAVRYRLDDSGGFDRTVIEGDLDRDGAYEIEIRLEGAYALVVVENV